MRYTLCKSPQSGRISILKIKDKRVFYSGMPARYYDYFFPQVDEQELAFFAKHIAAAPGPALEIGCGTGRLLLPLMQQGLDVAGVDSAAEMLSICTQKAQSLGVAPTLYQQQMQELSLPKQYGSIFSPLGTFGQLADRDEAIKALKAFYQHLLPGGRLVIYVHLPWHHAPEFGQWHAHAPLLLPDGTTLQVHEKSVHDPIEQLVFSTYRYELSKQNTIIAQQEVALTTRWYARHEFQMLLEQVGFVDISVCSGYEDQGPFDVMLFCAQKGA